MNQNRKLRRFLSLALALVLPAMLPLQALAAEPATGKEEVVYAKVDKGGMPKTVSVVNIFRLDADGKIVDHGDYTAVHNLTTTDPVKKEGDTITADGKKGVFYLQGDNPKAALPWDVRASYMLDGQTITPDTLGGKSGRLNLHVTVGKNPGADPVFFKYYIVQITLQFPKDKVKILSAEGATQAVAGEKTVLNYTLLPNKEGDFRIEAQVNDFAMDALQATALPFNMNFDMPNISDYTKEFSQLRYAAIQLDDGAQQLKNGLGTLAGRGGELVDGANKLSDGASQLSGGSGSFHSGMTQFQQGLVQYQAGVGQFAAGLGSFTTGLQQFSAGATQWKDGVFQFRDGANTYLNGVLSYTGGVTQSVSGVQQLAGGLKQLSDTLVNVPTYNKQLIDGSTAMQKALSDMAAGMNAGQMPTQQQAVDMAVGSQNLYNNLGQLANQTNTLATTLDQLVVAVSGAANGTAAIAGNLNNPNLTALGITDPKNADVEKLLVYMKNNGGQLTTISGGLSQTVTGMHEVRNGVAAVSGGLAAMQQSYAPLNAFIQGMPAMIAQLETMKKGINDLSNGYSQFHKALVDYTTLMNNTVSGVVKQAADGAVQAAAGLQQLSDAGPGMVQGGQQLLGSVQALGDGAGSLAGAASQLAQGAATASTGAGGLKDGIAALTGNFDKLVGGSGSFLSGLQGFSSGLQQYAAGVSAYLSGIAQTRDGAAKLAGGTSQLRAGTNDMEQQIRNKVEEALKEYKPGDFKPVSFVSAKNTEVKRVQFVYMGEEIKAPKAAETPAEKPAEKGIIEKIGDLFKWQK